MNRELERYAAEPPVHQGAIFQRLRHRILMNSGLQVLGQSPVRVATMIACSLVVWGFVYGISYFGFGLLAERKIPGAGGIIGVLFDLMFFALGGMLIFSTGLIAYASLFTAPETRYLLCTPARADQIFAYKLQSAVVFSSSAFVILCSPILLAYGLVFQVPWYFYAMLPAYFLGFVILPGSLGSLISLFIVNYLPKQRKQALILLILALVAGGIIWFIRLMIYTRQSFIQRDALQDLVGQFAWTQSAWTPSHWMTSGLLALSRSDFLGALPPLALIWSNALMMFVITAFVAGRIYRRGYDRLSTGTAMGRKYGTVWLDRVMGFLVGYLDRQTRLLILKDFRTFRRDPSQWAQILIFMGLIMLYVLNSRQFYQQDIGRSFQNGISLLNLCATALLMTAYLGRFIYPMLSLEGRKFWILGLLPLKREQLLWGKFAFAITGGLIVAMMLVALSDIVLGMPWIVVGLHVLTVTALSLGLSGLSVGLSAWLPNFRETDPSKIVVGFGGTVNMIISLLFLVLMIVLMAGPYHLYLAGTTLLKTPDQGFPWWTLAGLPFGFILAALAVWLPMRVGIRTLQRMEF